MDLRASLKSGIQEFAAAKKQLQAAGANISEIAKALGVFHRRFHEMVETQKAFLDALFLRGTADTAANLALMGYREIFHDRVGVLLAALDDAVAQRALPPLEQFTTELPAIEASAAAWKRKRAAIEKQLEVCQAVRAASAPVRNQAYAVLDAQRAEFAAAHQFVIAEIAKLLASRDAAVEQSFKAFLEALALFSAGCQESLGEFIASNDIRFNLGQTVDSLCTALKTFRSFAITADRL